MGAIEKHRKSQPQAFSSDWSSVFKLNSTISRQWRGKKRTSVDGLKAAATARSARKARMRTEAMVCETSDGWWPHSFLLHCSSTQYGYRPTQSISPRSTNSSGRIGIRYLWWYLAGY
eukprot:2646008-Rhodomonas_salina.4